LASVLLSKHGANIDAVDNDGLTPLAIAAQNGKIKAAQALVAAGADVNAPVAKGGYTPLMLASISGSTELASLFDRTWREGQRRESRRRDRADDCRGQRNRPASSSCCSSRART
jgi:hypothetical protein